MYTRQISMIQNGSLVTSHLSIQGKLGFQQSDSATCAVFSPQPRHKVSVCDSLCLLPIHCQLARIKPMRYTGAV